MHFTSEHTEQGLTKFFTVIRLSIILFSCHAVPLEIRTRGPQALEAYRRALESGECCDRRVPVMIVGQGRAGKTSLLKSLKGEKFKEKENTTHGIETWSFRKDVWRAGEWADGDSDERFAREAARLTSEILKDRVPRRTSPRRVLMSPKSKGSKLDQVCVRPRLIQRKAGLSCPPCPNLPFAVEEAMESRTEDSETDPELIFWDFAGQAVFYTTHPFFLSRKAIYILTFDLSKGLDEKAESVVMIDEHEEVVPDSDCGMTNMDYIHYWLSSIQTFGEDDSSESTSDKLPEKLPPVFLVGTHADECPDCGEVFNRSERGWTASRMRSTWWLVSTLLLTTPFLEPTRKMNRSRNCGSKSWKWRAICRIQRTTFLWCKLLDGSCFLPVFIPSLSTLHFLCHIDGYSENKRWIRGGRGDELDGPRFDTWCFNVDKCKLGEINLVTRQPEAWPWRGVFFDCFCTIVADLVFFFHQLRRGSAVTPSSLSPWFINIDLLLLSTLHCYSMWPVLWVGSEGCHGYLLVGRCSFWRGASLPGAATPKLIWSMSLAGSDTGIQLLIRLCSFLDGSI